MTELEETIAVLKTGRVVAQWVADRDGVPAVSYTRGRWTMLVVPHAPEPELTPITIQFFRDGVSFDLAEFGLADD